jgi:hypothetical protein
MPVTPKSNGPSLERFAGLDLDAGQARANNLVRTRTGKGMSGSRTRHDKRQPTLNDVARISGFSKKTVSRVVNQLRVRQATRELIEAAIARIDYAPDLVARELALKKVRETR